MAHPLAASLEKMPGICEPDTLIELQVHMGLARHDAANHAVLKVTGHIPPDPFFNVRHDCSDNLP
jgi:hypothetical protein